MIKKSFVKLILSIIMINTLITPKPILAQGNISENYTLSNQVIADESEDIFLNSLPDEEKLEIENSDLNTEVVGQTYEFYKYELKDNSKAKTRDTLTEDDYNVVKSNLNEFKASVKLKEADKLRQLVAPGVWESSDLNNPVVMHGIKVTKRNGKYRARSSFTWSRAPHVTVMDAVGITCPTFLQLPREGSKVYAEMTQKRYQGAGKPPIIHREGIAYGDVEVAPGGNGIAIAVKPVASADFNTGYIEADIVNTDTNWTDANITSEYLSTGLKFGTLSFTALGQPSFGFNVGQERFTESVRITKN